jgi:hypothetical protein
MGRPSRPKLSVAPAVVDEVALEHRYRSLSRWAQLTVAGEGIQLTHSGSLADRLKDLEGQLDSCGLRDEAERKLRPPGPVVSRPAWMSRPDDDTDRSAA